MAVLRPGGDSQGEGESGMKTKDIRNALKSRLAGGDLGPGAAWPNVDSTASRPYFAVSTEVLERVGGTLKGDEILYERGQFNVIVVVDQGGGEDAALDYADDVAALFLEGQRIDITDGEIVIQRPADIRGGYPADADYRVPVIIRYRATAHPE